MIGTVSPAGGNFEEPVTQSTLGTVKTFLGLSAARAYKRFYPAVDPLISWSRYLDQLRPYFDERLRPGWTEAVRALSRLLHQGDSIYQMMQVTGEEGVTLEDYVTYQKSLFLDMVYLQQDAFDPVDASTPQDRQKEAFEMIRGTHPARLPIQGQGRGARFFHAADGSVQEPELRGVELPGICRVPCADRRTREDPRPCGKGRGLENVRVITFHKGLRHRRSPNFSGIIKTLRACTVKRVGSFVNLLETTWSMRRIDK